MSNFCYPMDCNPQGSAIHGIPRQEYWSWLPFPSPRDLPNPGIKPRSPALIGGFLTTEPPGKPMYMCVCVYIYVYIYIIYHILIQFNNTMIWLCSLCLRKPSYFSCLSLTIQPHKYDSTLSLSHIGKYSDSLKISCYLSKLHTKFKSFTYMCFLIHLPHFWNIWAVLHHMPLRNRKWLQYVF